MIYGGYWDKLGNRYEDWWSLVKLMDMLGGESDITSLAREPAGEDERGVDLWVNRPEGRRDAHQCKRRKGPSAGWTMRVLQSEGIFDELKFQLDRSPKHRYVLVSGTAAPDFERLLQEARDSKDAESFYRDQIRGNQGLQAAFKVFRESVAEPPGSEGPPNYEYNLLQRSEFRLFRASEEEHTTLRERARVAIEGEASAVLSLLGDWLRDQLRTEVDVASVEAFLDRHGYRLRPDLRDESRAGAKRLQSRFRRSLRPTLAGGKLIPRNETRRVLDLLDDEDVRVVVVHGAAGKGKSGVTLELVEELSRRETVFLPVRLDRVEVQGGPHEFGRDLGLPDTPGRCLQALGPDGAVLVLDQLDALRWTGAHSSQAWEVCRETIEDALETSSLTKVVVCCRTFDLEHDPQFRQWKKEAESLAEVLVGDLTVKQVEDAVEEAVASQGGRKPSGREAALLRHVHHLQMWLEIYPDLGPDGSLQSRRQLMESFWQDRRDKLRDQARISSERIEQLEDRLVDEMDEGASLTAPLSALRLSGLEEEAYRSLHILQVDPVTNQVSFCHQSYLDYLVALRLVSQLRDAEGSLESWLGPCEKQSLFRREQLRLVLEELRSRDPELYIGELRSLLDASDVRFHLRLLCLQFLSQISEPTRTERQLILDTIGGPDWRAHVLQEVVGGNPAWFAVLDDAGVLQQWLKSDESDLLTPALSLIRSAAEACGDRVARLLRPYVEKGGEWPQRLQYGLGEDPASDSDSLFELRIQLTEMGLFRGEWVEWKDLAEANPDHFLTLLCKLLAALAKNLRQQPERHAPGRASQPRWLGLEEVSPQMIPTENHFSAWRRLITAISLVAGVRKYDFEPARILESFAVDFRILEPVIQLLRRIGGALLETNSETVKDMGVVAESLGRGGEILLMDSLGEAEPDQDLADWALEWMMADPWRVRLKVRKGAGSYSLSARVIERCSRVCSGAAFQRLEKWLLTYSEPDLLDRYRRRHELIQKSASLKLPSDYGRTQYALLLKIPAERASIDTFRRLAELERKFGKSKVDFYNEGRLTIGGLVTSPVGHEVLGAMSDAGVRNLLTSRKLRQGRTLTRWVEGHVYETSIGTIASDLQAATQRDPERFGRLLFNWPSDGYPEFLKAIVFGLSYPGDLHRTTGEETQVLPSHELLESVLALPIIQEMARSPGDTEVARRLCDFLERYPDFQWSQQAREFVAWVAQHHPDPAPNYFPVGVQGGTAGRVENLELNGLNVTRGNAALTIQKLLFSHPEYLPDFREAMDSLVRDDHLGVRLLAVGASLPVLNIDRDQAVSWFVEACSGPDQILATREASNFLRYVFRTHLDRLLATLERMLASSLPAVVAEGAKWVAAAYLMDGRLGVWFENCISGSEAQRKGVAWTAAGMLGDAGSAQKAIETLLRLAEDPDEDVAKTVAEGFKGLNRQHITKNRQAWDRFARSRAFRVEPTHLLHALHEQSGDLLPFADCILAVGTTFAEDLAEESRDYSHRLSGNVSHYLTPMLLRLYEQAKDRDQEVYLGCLDLWDCLLEARVGRAMNLTRELDRI